MGEGIWEQPITAKCSLGSREKREMRKEGEGGRRGMCVKGVAVGWEVASALGEELSGWEGLQAQGLRAISSL